MKKLLAILLTIVISLCLCGCELNKKEMDIDNANGRMTVIYNDFSVEIYVDNETGVQYIFGGYKGVCVMVDENGKPLIYQQAEKVGD